MCCTTRRWIINQEVQSEGLSNTKTQGDTFWFFEKGLYSRSHFLFHLNTCKTKVAYLNAIRCYKIYVLAHIWLVNSVFPDIVPLWCGKTRVGTRFLSADYLVPHTVPTWGSILWFIILAHVGMLDLWPGWSLAELWWDWHGVTKLHVLIRMFKLSYPHRHTKTNNRVREMSINQCLYTPTQSWEEV